MLHFIAFLFVFSFSGNLKEIQVYDKNELLNDNALNNFVERSLGFKEGDYIDNEKLDFVTKELVGKNLCSDIKTVFNEDSGVLKVYVNFHLLPLRINIKNQIKNNLLFSEENMAMILNNAFPYWQPKIANSVYLNCRAAMDKAFVMNQDISINQNVHDGIMYLDVVLQGEVKHIHSINLVGNRAISDFELHSYLIEKGIGTHEDFSYLAWYFMAEQSEIFLMNNDKPTVKKYLFSHEKEEEICDLINGYIRNKGYLDLKVNYYSQIVGDSVNMFFLLDEGEKYKFGEVEIRSDTKNIDVEEVKSRLSFLFNEPFSDSLFSQFINEISDDFNYEIKLKSKSSGLFNHCIILKEKDLDTIYNIKFKGNIPVDEVFLREYMGISEGDVVSGKDVKKVEKKLQDLNIFTHIEVKKAQPEDVRYQNNYCDIIIEGQCRNNFHFQGLQLNEITQIVKNGIENIDTSVSSDHVLHLQSLPIRIKGNLNHNFCDSFQDIKEKNWDEIKKLNGSILDLEVIHGPCNLEVSYQEEVFSLTNTIQVDKKTSLSSLINSNDEWEAKIIYEDSLNFFSFQIKDPNLPQRGSVFQLNYSSKLPILRVLARPISFGFGIMCNLLGDLAFSYQFSSMINDILQMIFAFDFQNFKKSLTVRLKFSTKINFTYEILNYNFDTSKTEMGGYVIYKGRGSAIARVLAICQGKDVREALDTLPTIQKMFYYLF